MDEMHYDEGGKDRNFVTALARGLELLRCFRDGEVTLTNSDFSDRTGLPKATVSRLTYTLCALDYLVADTRAGTYRLSAGVLHLGFSVLSSIDIQDLAHVEMEKLREELNGILAKTSGQPLDKIQQDTDRDFYLNAEEAIEYGLADKIVDKI